MHTQRLAVMIIAAIGMLTTFMPWVNAPIIGGIDGTHGDGWITMALFAIPAIICLINDKTKPLAGNMLYAAVVPALIAEAIAIWKIVDFKASMENLGNDNPFGEMLGATVSIGFGLYLLILSAIALPVAAFLMKSGKNEQA